MAKQLTALERRVVALEAASSKLAKRLSIAQKKLLAQKLNIIQAKLDEVLVAETTSLVHVKTAELNALIQQEFATLNALQTADIDKMLTVVYNDTRLGISKDLGIEFDTTNEFQLNRLKNITEDGMNFSQRLYKNNAIVAQRVQNDISRMLYMDATPTEIKRAIAKDFNISYNAADRLIRTEASKMYNAAANDSYVAAGIHQVEWLTEKDDRTCEICGPLNGKRFETGTIAAPAHPNCRCTILPVIED